MSELRSDIERAINAASAENGSDTPDYVLAEFLMDCLRAFDAAVRERERWYGRGDPRDVPRAPIKMPGP